MTLISDTARAPYSGMLPGWIARRFTEQEITIDLERLAARAGVVLRIDTVTGLDLERREAHLRDGGALPYDLLSLNVGGRPVATTPGAAAHAVPTRPVHDLLRAIERVDHLAAPRVLVCGAGAAGVEVAMALRTRWGEAARITLIGREKEVTPSFARAARFLLSRQLARRGIELKLGEDVAGIGPTSLRLESGAELAHDLVIWATPVRAQSWLRASGLAVIQDGSVAVEASLASSSHPEVFAVGDVAGFLPRPLPKSGVYAVREAPILATNLRRRLAGQALVSYRPQKHALALMPTGDGRAYYVRGWRVAGGRWALRLKDRIDRSFMAQFEG